MGIVLAVGVIAPLAAVVIRRTGQPGALADIGRILTGNVFVEALIRTAIIGAVASAITTVLATAIAWLVHRTDMPFRGIIGGLVVVPFFIPVLVTAIAWSLLSDPRSGLVNQALRAVHLPFTLNLNNVQGIVLVLALALAPVAYILVRDAIADPSAEQEEAALVAGSTALRVTMRVTLPRILPSIGATYLIIAVIDAANFSVPAVLGMAHGVNMLSTEIFVATNTYPVDYARVAVVALSLVILLVGLLAIQRQLERRAQDRADNSAHGVPIIWRLGAWRWLCFVLCLLFAVIALVLPVGAIVVNALLPYLGASLRSITTANVSQMLSSSIFQDTLLNTLTFAAFGALIATAIGILAAYIFRRLRPPGSAVWDLIASAPIALPGIAVGLGYLWIAVGTPLYGTLLVMILVAAIRYFPFALRSTSASLIRIGSSLDEAARVVGGSEKRVFLGIIMPNIGRSSLGSFALIFLLFTHEVDSIVLLAGTQNNVLSVQVYNWYENGQISLAACGALALLVMTGAIFTVMAVVMRGQSGSKAVM